MAGTRPLALDDRPKETIARQAPDDDQLDPSVWKVCAVALCGALLSQLDATIVNVSLSSLAHDLHASLSTIQWVTSGYLLALTLVLPLNGWLVDRIGAKALYLWCFSAFTLSSALCGLAWSANALIGFRVLQGVSGGLLAPMTQMMVARAAGKHLARVAGYITVPVLVAPILGPIIAGAILQYASWRWLFLVNLPIGVIALALAVLFLPNDREDARRRTLDWLGLALLSPGLVLFLYGAERIRDEQGLLLFLSGIVMLAAFLGSAWRKGDAALIDLRLFRIKVFSTASVTQFLSNGATFAGQMLIPAFLIQVCGRAPAEMGWMLAPLGAGMLLTNPMMGSLTDRFGIRRVSAGGALLALLATISLLFLTLYGLSLLVLVAALFLRGMGMGAVGLPSLTVAYAAVRREELPMATTSLNIVQRLGGPTLTTACAAVLAWRLGSHVTGADASAGFASGLLILCVIHLLTFMSALRLPRRREDVAVPS